MLSGFLVILGMLLAIAAGSLHADLFQSLAPHINLLVAIILLAAGVQFNIKSLRSFKHTFHFVASVFAVRYFVLAILTYLIISHTSLPYAYQVGIVLIIVCPAAAASSFMSSLAKANVSFSVITTFLSTLTAPILIPILIYLFFHKNIQIHYIKMSESLMLLIGLPICCGIALQTFMKKQIEIIRKFLFVLGLLAVMLLTSYNISIHSQLFSKQTLNCLLLVIALNSIVLIAAYLLTKLVIVSRQTRIAFLFEVSMTDISIALAISVLFFNAQTALPIILYGLWQTLTSLTIASFKRKQEVVELSYASTA